jgi:hypothetical protein
MDELNLRAAEKKTLYDKIKAYVLEKFGMNVSSLYILQIKQKCGLDVRQNYNLLKKEDAKVSQYLLEKETVIMDTLKHFQKILVIFKLRVSLLNFAFNIYNITNI